MPRGACVRCVAARRAAAGWDMRSGAPLGTDQRVGRQTTETHLRRRGGREARFQRLGPTAGGGAERGLGGCWRGDVVVVRLVAGTVAVAGFWLGVCGSWSRMRHQRAAAGWSLGRGPAPAADRTRTTASKPAQARFVNL